MHAIRSMRNYIANAEYLDRSPFRRVCMPKKERKTPISLSVQELESLIAVTEFNRYAEMTFGDRSIISVLVYTGVRRQELLDLTRNDVDLKKGVIWVLKGKGGGPG